MTMNIANSANSANSGNAANTAKPYDVKREDFRKYLEHAGVMDVMTNILVTLYYEHERPDDALDYIRKYFFDNDSNKSEPSPEVEALKKELEDARAKISELKAKLAKYEHGDTL